MSQAPQAPRQLVLPIVPEGVVVPFPLVPVPPPQPSDDAVVRLHKRLASLLGEPIDLVPTSNRRNLLSWGREHGLLCIRIQRQFALADDETVLVLAAHIRHGSAQTAATIREVAQGFDLGRRPPRAPRVHAPSGRHHDLGHHLDQQNLAHFGGRFEAKIGWALRAGSMGRRTIRLGSWHAPARLIRIHPILDHKDVPDFVIGFVVFHEMLHGRFHVERSDGRRVVHGPAFRTAERAHPDFERADRWIAEHVASLLGERT
jgi:hypothetical protein